MTQVMITIMAPLPQAKLAEATAAIDGLQNPARPDIAAALDQLDNGDGTHFVSLHALESGDGTGAYLVLEMSADGTEQAAVARLAQAIGPMLAPVFTLASDWSNGDLARYLSSHRITNGSGLFDHPGINFGGTPGMTVGRIRSEGQLAARIAALLGRQPGGMSAMARLETVRGVLKTDPEFAFALSPAEAAPPYAPQSTPALIAGLAGSFVSVYLWPLAIPLVAWTLYSGVAATSGVQGFGPSTWAFVAAALPALATWSFIALIAAAVVLLCLYLSLRQQEAADWLEARPPDRAILAEMTARENRAAQNHMLSVTRRKPGIVRWFTARLIFWAIGQLAARLYPPGFLSDIGTIHFARWVTIPNSRDFLFFSNYGGSWESYLEDFITKAHAGLTGVWSNAIGFPRSENLIQLGATDGERFKRYARHSMLPTRFWYTAYPTLTTANIRVNADIRRGLSGAMTEDEAMVWLSSFGSASRPESKLESNEIQSLIFGGLKFLPFGSCLLYRLPDDPRAAKTWLGAVTPDIAFDDGRRLQAPAVVTLALTAGGLARLGLPAEGLDTFPPAFLDGMAARARILGDVAENDPRHWRWGNEDPPDAAVLVYGETGAAVAALEAKLRAIDQANGAHLLHSVPLKTITDDKREPFGFADGISQPIIRGTYKALRNADSIHVVEPGEFILGYPDNRGNLPPGPLLAALADPGNLLPLLETGLSFSTTLVESPRAPAANGSFLVIRQLEQDVGGFDAYCAAEADRLQSRLPVPYRIDANFIAAKLVGRWQDGASMVRHPYAPPTREDKVKEERRLRSHPREPVAIAASAAAPDAAPDAATPPSIDPPAAASTAKDNDFLFGIEDPEALRCPFGAHIRRANPRDSLDPGSADQIAISNRHRIIRVGRQYAPGEGENPGLFFMCLNGDLERQFEFTQQTWLGSPSFHGLSCERDPLVSDGDGINCSFTIPSRDGPVRLNPVPRFVTVTGGGYFFLPGKRLIAFLAQAA